MSKFISSILLITLYCNVLAQNMNAPQDINIYYFKPTHCSPYFKIQGKNSKQIFDSNGKPTDPPLKYLCKASNPSEFSYGWKSQYRHTGTKNTSNMGYNYVDVNGNYMDLDNNYRVASEFSEGLAMITFYEDHFEKIRKNWNIKGNVPSPTAFIDSTGKIVLPPIYSGASHFKFQNGFTVVSKYHKSVKKNRLPNNNEFIDVFKYQVIDKSGNVLYELPYNNQDLRYQVYDDGFIRYRLSNSDKSEIVICDKFGEVLTKVNISNTSDYDLQILEGDKEDGITLIMNHKEKKSWVWYKDKKPEEIPYNYYLDGFYNGMVMTKKEAFKNVIKAIETGYKNYGANQIGYFNTKGEMAVPFKYSNGSIFSANRALVQSNSGAYILIDNNGNEIESQKLNF